MKISLTIFLLAVVSSEAFVPSCRSAKVSTALSGYLDNISSKPVEKFDDHEEDEDPEKYSREATKLAKEKVANFGVGDWSGFVDFNEFDGGDGQVSSFFMDK
jgi:hypothetical protein